MGSELIEFSNEQKAVIKSQFFPQGTSNAEMQYNMQVAKDLGLSPILKEIYFVERKSQVNGQWVTKVEPLAGKNAFMKLAHNSGQFNGLKVECMVKDVPTLENRQWINKSDLVAIATVHRKDMEEPFVVEVAYNEYVQRKRDGTPTKFWAEKSQTMLKKVAVSQALKEAFSVSGIYTEEEINIDHQEEKPTEHTQIENKPKVNPMDIQEDVAEAEVEEVEVITVKTINAFYGQLSPEKQALSSGVFASHPDWRGYDVGGLDMILSDLKAL